VGLNGPPINVTFPEIVPVSLDPPHPTSASTARQPMTNSERNMTLWSYVVGALSSQPSEFCFRVKATLLAFRAKQQSRMKLFSDSA
jgi:hypothetical protein